MVNIKQNKKGRVIKEAAPFLFVIIIFYFDCRVIS